MIDPPDLLAGASRLRQGVPCSFADDNPYVGSSHRVFKVVFEDSVQWAARHIKEQCPEIKAPNLYIEAGLRVIYSEWVAGNPLAIWNSKIPLVKRQSLLDDLAEFLLQLWTITVPSALASEQEDPYSAWLTQSLDRGLRRTLTGTARWGDATDYLIMRSMIPEYAAEFDKYIGVGFAHGDLNAFNVMINDDFNLTGVIDWDWMYVAPLPAVIHHPWFIADIPGWNNVGVANAESFEEDRAYLENAVKKREISRHLPLTVSTLLRDSGKRLFFQSAFHVRGIHEMFVTMHCPRTEENIKAARSQLDIVLRLYPELGDSDNVQRFKDALGRQDEY
ncbi:hypothetical protein N7535_006469 [Penicillium sp. DV-2018c]|nr:hypothetical protein N7535_006469 [Penicillium sp. DV-2018c]